MVLRIARHYGMLHLLVCIVFLALPMSVFGECRVIEYPDHNEIVCESQAGRADRKERPKSETTKLKEFVFYSPVKTGTKIHIFADWSPIAIASPGDMLLSYRIDDVMDKTVSTSTKSFKYEERSGDTMFTIREFGNGDFPGGMQMKTVMFDDKKNYLLLMPYKSGCSSATDDAIYLKMNRFEGGRLYYQIIISPCLSQQLDQSIAD